MSHLCLVLNNGYPDIMPAVERQKNGSGLSEIGISCERSVLGGKTSLTLRWPETKEKEVFCLITEALWNYIAGELKYPVIEEFLVQNGELLSTEEINKLLALIAEETGEEMQGFAIKDKLQEYLHEGYAHLNLEGFLRFRLPDLFRFLEEKVYFYLGDYFASSRRYTYLGILKMQLSMRSSRIEVLHLDLVSSGELYLYADKSAEGGESSSMSYCFEEKGKGEDTIINILVSLAPRRLVLHKNFLSLLRLSSTLKAVFQERVSLCRGCSACRAQTPELT